MDDTTLAERKGTAAEVFGAFLKLGLTSFGGPIAHLGYFRDDLVVRRRWVEDATYTELVALCQFLPGPTSSQAGFVLGLLRAGPLGGIAAWLAFTTPSALIMLLLAWGMGGEVGPVAERVFHGLKLVAVVIVAQAVWGMSRTLTPDLRRLLIAAAAGVVVAVAGGAFGQVGAIVLGAGSGLLLCRNLAATPSRWQPTAINRRIGAVALVVFTVLLTCMPLLANAAGWRGLHLFDIFYRAGALVFGGGHVVLPLLRAELVPTGWITDDRFLAGYGAAQALPGPLFASATFFGFVGGGGVTGALVALLGIFLPGMLVVIGALPFWLSLRPNVFARSAIAGVNGAVVGILAFALYDPLWTSSVSSWRDVVLIGVGLFAMLRWRVPPLAIVAAIVSTSLLLTS